MKYFIFILGCQMNYADANRLRAVLESCKLKESSEKNADLVIVVACSVRQKPIQRIWGKVRNWKKQNKKIWITGCVLPSDKKKFENKIDKVFKIDEISNIPKWLGKKQTIEQKYLEICPSDSKPSDFQYLLPIMTGCNNFCSYCAVPYCRGREVSRSSNTIIDELKTAIKNGNKRLLLLGQNVNSYKPNFVKLLRKIELIKGDFSFNFMTSHPKDLSPELIKFLSESVKWERSLHLPLQSGSDRILKKMNRKYTAKKYLELISKLKSNIENLEITTDIIVGFPTETKKDFSSTLEVLKAVKPAKVYVSQFSPRPNTVAYKMRDNVNQDEKKRRWKKINVLYN